VRGYPFAPLDRFPSPVFSPLYLQALLSSVLRLSWPRSRLQRARRRSGRQRSCARSPGRRRSEPLGRRRSRAARPPQVHCPPPACCCRSAAAAAAIPLQPAATRHPVLFSLSTRLCISCSPAGHSAPPPAGCWPLPLQERRHPPAAGTLQEPPPARCRNPGKDSRTDAAADCVAVSCGVCTQVDYL